MEKKISPQYSALAKKVFVLAFLTIAKINWLRGLTKYLFQVSPLKKGIFWPKLYYDARKKFLSN